MPKTVNTPAPISADNLLAERFIGDAELCGLLGWARTTPATLRCRGRMPIPFYRIGSSIRYRESDIAAYLNSARVNPKTGTITAE